jgi:hypothetical protein
VKDWGQSPLSRVPITTFLPEQLGADLWLDASDTNTITAAGGSVSQWNNKGSLGNFTQASGAVQPTTGATTLNGKNVIDFAADYLTAADTNEWKFLHDGTKWIVAAVAKFGNSADPNANYGLFGNNLNSALNIGTFWQFDDRASASTNNAWRVTISTGSPFAVDTVSADVVTPNAATIVSGLVDAGNASAASRLALHFNAGSALSSNTSTGAPSSSNPSAALQIGSRGDNNIPLTGYIAEIVIVSGANATETNRAALRDYLNDKWAVY